MKNYDDLTSRLLERRNGYVAEQKKKKQTITRVTASVGSVALVSLLGFALLRSDAFRDAPPVTDSSATTTTATKYTEERILITADELDDYTNNNDGFLIPYRRPGEKFISPALQQKMELYEDADVVYAVIVTIFLYVEDYDGFWESTEELSQFCKEYNDVHNAFYNEAKRLNPSWRGTNIDYIEIWTDEMRANYEYWLSLCNKREELKQKYEPSYIDGIRKDRFAVLSDLSKITPIKTSVDSLIGEDGCSYGFYVELNADAINALAECGGYTFNLALANEIDPAGWSLRYND